MHQLIRRTITHPALALGSTVLWGLIECLALYRCRRAVPKSVVPTAATYP